MSTACLWSPLDRMPHTARATAPLESRMAADGTKRRSTRRRSSSARSRLGSRRRHRPLELRGQLADEAIHLAGEPSASASAARSAVCATEVVRPRRPAAPASAPQSCVEPRPGRAAGGTRPWRQPAPAPAGRTAPSPAPATRSAGPRSSRAGAAQGGQRRRATLKGKPPPPGPGRRGSGAAACAGAGGAGPSCRSASADGRGEGQRGTAAGRASRRSPAGGSAPLCCVRKTPSAWKDEIQKGDITPHKQRKTRACGVYGGGVEVRTTLSYRP